MTFLSSQVMWAHAFRAHAKQYADAKWWAKLPAHPAFRGLCYTETSLLADVITMSRYRRANIPGATYFFTVVTYRHRPILCDAPVRAALRDAIKTVRSRHPFTIDAWVLLLDHVHCVWTNSTTNLCGTRHTIPRVAI